MKLNEALLSARQGASVVRSSDTSFYLMYINGHTLRRSYGSQRWSLETKPFIPTLEESQAEDWTTIVPQPSEADDPAKQFTYSSGCYMMAPGIKLMNTSLNLAV